LSCSVNRHRSYHTLFGLWGKRGYTWHFRRSGQCRI
jgi:hypothetical protein